MRRSKMEMYLSTLQALICYGPLKITRITYKAKMNYFQLKPILSDLIQKKLVEERKIGANSVVYSATAKARNTISHFNELNKIFLIITEDNQATTLLSSNSLAKMQLR
jgi:predicted transcriptional regulator